MTNKFAIFTSVNTPEEIIFATSLGKSLRILGINIQLINLICVLASDIPYSETELANLQEVWSSVVSHMTAEQKYLNVLVGHLYTTYKSIMYVDPYTVFFNSPVHLFSMPTPAAFFNSIHSSHMIKLYNDILGYPADINSENYTMGHLHIYGNLVNNSPIDAVLLKQAVSGTYARYLDIDLKKIDYESRVMSIDTKFMVFKPDIDLYQNVFTCKFKDNGYLLGSVTDKILTNVYAAIYDAPWYNLMHNYRVPNELIRLNKNKMLSVIYRKDTLEGIISNNLAIYSIEASHILSEKINKLTLFDINNLQEYCPKLEDVSYISKEHKIKCSQLV